MTGPRIDGERRASAYNAFSFPRKVLQSKRLLYRIVSKAARRQLRLTSLNGGFSFLGLARRANLASFRHPMRTLQDFLEQENFTDDAQPQRKHDQFSIGYMREEGLHIASTRFNVGVLGYGTCTTEEFRYM